MKKYQGPWTEKQRRHLLTRTLFGATAEDLQFFGNKSMEQCVEVLLHALPLPPPPVFSSKDDPPQLKNTSFVFAAENKERDEDWRIYVRAWWVGLLLNTPNNIREKMVLFWHNHFVVEFNVVKDARYAYHYVNLLRKHALGNFKELLREITTSPAMLVYLNGNVNNKNTPNENYGRELQELFTVGKGPGSHYTEGDVKAAARVLTGWKDDKRNISSYFEPTQHVAADKTFSAFYGHRVIKGQGDAAAASETDELLDMICSNAEVSMFLCRKLYRWFVQSHISEQAEREVISPLAAILRGNNYEMKPVLQALLTADFFYEPALVGAMVKSPADYFIGTLRQLHLKMNKRSEGGNPDQYLGAWFLVSQVLTALGQQIGDPPSVAGWPAYYEFPSFDKNWISSEYLSMRNRYKDFSFDGFNPPDNPYVEFDLIYFARHLQDASTASGVIKDCIQLMCNISPGEKQLNYLEDILDAKKSGGPDWAHLWNKQKSSAYNKVEIKELTTRLRKAFDVILMLPEYQIM